MRRKERINEIEEKKVYEIKKIKRKKERMEEVERAKLSSWWHSFQSGGNKGLINMVIKSIYHSIQAKGKPLKNGTNLCKDITL